MANSLMQRLKKSSLLKAVEASSTDSLIDPEFTDTHLPILNIILSGKPNRGLPNGFTIIEGEQATYKSTLCLNIVSAYLKKHQDSICIFYDSENGTSLEGMKANGIDPERILYTPFSNIEELKLDIVRQLDEIKRGDKVIFFIDSLGMMASKKEAKDALEGKTSADMTKAKEIASLVRLICPALNAKEIPCIAINHVYKDIASFHGGFIGAGGSKLKYAANTIIQISKAQEKEGTELTGFKFTLQAIKSRYIKEKTKLPLYVSFTGGINKWSGLFDLALNLGWIVSEKQSWYQLLDKETGEIEEKKYRRKELESNDAIWERFLMEGLGDEIYKHIALLGIMEEGKEHDSSKVLFTGEDEEIDEDEE